MNPYALLVDSAPADVQPPARSLGTGTGTDTGAWPVALSLLRDFTGIVPELLASARTITSP
ncbi:hypothetical protein [Streptodolium elevatio]|uniref:Uncharacterized protein n=1 Tax=Streptodolium elevatio TaxID=3157996 RepID=A0ABV3DNU7_9ACTN